MAFLKQTTIDAGLTDRLKIQYRPLICPFDDLLSALCTYGPFSVFDVGCGSGQFALLIAQFTPATRISGIEIDDRLIDNARQLFARYDYKADISFRRYNGVDLPDEIAEHDVVTMVDVLHHIPPHLQESFLTQLYDKMRSGATLIIKDIDGASPFVWFNKLHDMIFAREIGNEWTAAKLKLTGQRIGFQIESLTTKRRYVYPHYTLVLRK